MYGPLLRLSFRKTFICKRYLSQGCIRLQVPCMGDAADKADPAPGPAPAFGTQSSYYNDAAALYADPKIRLHYPAELFERVYAFAGGPFSAALDVGTGTGQCAQQLALKYQQVGAVTSSHIAKGLQSFRVSAQWANDASAEGPFRAAQGTR